jgi:hypothetical protein
MCTLDFCYCPTMKRVYLIQGNQPISGANKIVILNLLGETY